MNYFQSGFSLIELVFAMFFLSVIILGVVNLQSSNLAMMNRQNNEIQAHLLAHQGIQLAKLIDFAKIQQEKQNCNNSNQDPCIKYLDRNNLTDRKEEPINNLFERAFEIKSYPELPNSLEITCYIEWTDTIGEHKKWQKNALKPAEAKIMVHSY